MFLLKLKLELEADKFSFAWIKIKQMLEEETTYTMTRRLL